MYVETSSEDSRKLVKAREDGGGNSRNTRAPSHGRALQVVYTYILKFAALNPLPNILTNSMRLFSICFDVLLDALQLQPQTDLNRIQGYHKAYVLSYFSDNWNTADINYCANFNLLGRCLLLGIRELVVISIIFVAASVASIPWSWQAVLDSMLSLAPSMIRASSQ